MTDWLEGMEQLVAVVCVLTWDVVPVWNYMYINGPHTRVRTEAAHSIRQHQQKTDPLQTRFKVGVHVKTIS